MSEIFSLVKSYDVFKPTEVKEAIHIIGCGSVGSTVAVLLAKYGLTNIKLYDFDAVEPHNLTNQMFRQEHVGKSKTESVRDMILELNPAAKDGVVLFNDGWTGQRLSGYVFLCVDNIELRREIAEKNKKNIYVKAMFDFRTRLFDAQHYGADWSDVDSVEGFIGSMDFTHEEAAEETPVSACGVTLGVVDTVWLICCYGVRNFIQFSQGNKIKKMIQVDTENWILDAF